MKFLVRGLSVFMFVFLGALSAVAQTIERGTVVVVYYTTDKIIMAADSRVVSLDPNKPPQDDACKIATPDGKIVFASAGIENYASANNQAILGSYASALDFVQSWSNADEIHKAYQEASFQHSPMFQSTSALLMNAILERDVVLQTVRNFEGAEVYDLNALKTWHATLLDQVAEKQHGLLTEALVGGLDSGGRLVLYGTAIEYSDLGFGGFILSNTGTPVCPDAPYCFLGEYEIAREFVNLASDRAKKEAHKWKPPKNSSPLDYDILKAMRLVELTEQYGPADVGGPIDAVELDKDGTLRWFYNKKNCPAD